MQATNPDRRDDRTRRARALRRAMTDQERKLWLRLKDIPLPRSHFRKQVPIGSFFADFACHDAKLIIEIDGAQHATAGGVRRDAGRDACFRQSGYRVLRFWNHEVEAEIEAVLDTVYAALNDPDYDCDAVRNFAPPTPYPSPPRAGGGETGISRHREEERLIAPHPFIADSESTGRSIHHAAGNPLPPFMVGRGAGWGGQDQSDESQLSQTRRTVPIHFVIPGDLTLPTGGYAYDRRVLSLAAQAQLDLRHLAIPDSFPSPTPEDLQETARRIGLTGVQDILLIDGLALGAMPPDFVRALNRTIVALVHHPLGLESGLSPERSRFLIANEKDVLAQCAAVIVTSHDTARILADDFAVPRAKITVAEPGNDVCPRAAGSADGAPHLVAVGSVSPRKGYDLLIAALAPLAGLAWRLTIAGAVDRGGATFADLQRQAEACGFAGRIHFAGALSDAAIDALYQAADIFVMASRYEGYGMALTEAMAHGLPIVTTLSGAAAMQAPDAAALKVPVDDTDALTVALAQLIRDRDLRSRMADAAWRAAQALPRWDTTVARIAKTLHALGAGRDGV